MHLRASASGLAVRLSAERQGHADQCRRPEARSPARPVCNRAAMLTSRAGMRDTLLGTCLTSYAASFHHRGAGTGASSHNY